MIWLIPTPNLMGKTSFLLSLMVVLLLFPTLGNTRSGDSPHNINTDQLALLALKSHITHDPRSILATNWSTSTSVCNWIGVTCGSRHHRVTALNLIDMGLTGTVPPHLGNLSFLFVLTIWNNSFHGSLPIELVNLRRLKYLQFGGNNFKGEIPPWFGSFPKLQRLLLHNNHFTGVIPSTLGNLSKLERLSLFDNDFKDEIPSVIWNLTSLELLDLAENSLTGVIPSTIEHFISLLGLHLGDNNLTGRIPTLPLSLLTLDVSRNKLDGEIPSSICNLSSIRYLGLSANKLGGIIPECLGNLSFLNMYLHTNDSPDKIPETLFSQSCSLKIIHINKNQLEGPIPRSLVNCKDLEVVDLGNNKLNDTFPSWLGNLKNLLVLVLRSNRFYGHIANPEVASSFSQLQIIDLSGNDFNGRLPTKFFANLLAMIEGSRKKGEAVYAGNYSTYYYETYETIILAIKGSERFMRILAVLIVIDFSNNGFNEDIPKIIGELGSLIVLNLSHNRLTGPIPSSLGNLSNLESLDLSSNRLQGRIPEQLVNLNFLAVLNLSWNNLTGLIPRGSQFDTFTNESYNGNFGLRGFPLSKGCGNDQGLRPPPIKFDGTRREMNWKYSILIGYGCGLVFGLSMGYIVFTTGKPWWFFHIIERVQQNYIKRKIRKSERRK